MHRDLYYATVKVVELRRPNVFLPLMMLGLRFDLVTASTTNSACGDNMKYRYF